jgi:hypothetical protein
MSLGIENVVNHTLEIGGKKEKNMYLEKKAI